MLGSARGRWCNSAGLLTRAPGNWCPYRDRRILVACWIRRSDHPSRPRAKTCCFFSSFKALAMPTEPTSLRGNQCPERRSHWPVFR
jgi:hypothetical protein